MDYVVGVQREFRRASQSANHIPIISFLNHPYMLVLASLGNMWNVFTYLIVQEMCDVDLSVVVCRPKNKSLITK